MPAPTPSRPSGVVIAVIIIGIVGALVVWSFAPYLLGLFVFLLLGAAMTIAVIQSKQGKPLARCPHCNYDLRGLPRDTMKCPECGRLLSGSLW
jgi:hypothetical protein